MSSQSFSKSLRLLNSKDFQAIFDDAPFRSAHPSILLLARPGVSSTPRLGLIIAKKNVRLAVQRNRLKRHIRETFRLRQDQLGSVDVIALARKGLHELDDRQLDQLLNKQWNRVIRKASAAQTDKGKQS